MGEIVLLGKKEPPKNPLNVNNPKLAIENLQMVLQGVNQVQLQFGAKAKLSPKVEAGVMVQTFAIQEMMVLLDQFKSVAAYGIKSAVKSQIETEETNQRLINLRGVVEYLSTGPGKDMGAAEMSDIAGKAAAEDDRLRAGFLTIKKNYPVICEKVIKGESGGIEFTKPAEGEPEPA